MTSASMEKASQKPAVTKLRRHDPNDVTVSTAASGQQMVICKKAEDRTESVDRCQGDVVTGGIPLTGLLAPGEVAYRVTPPQPDCCAGGLEDSEPCVSHTPSHAGHCVTRLHGCLLTDDLTGDADVREGSCCSSWYGDVMESPPCCGDVMESPLCCGEVMTSSPCCGDVMESSPCCGDVMESPPCCGKGREGAEQREVANTRSHPLSRACTAQRNPSHQCPRKPSRGVPNSEIPGEDRRGEKMHCDLSGVTRISQVRPSSGENPPAAPLKPAPALFPPHPSLLHSLLRFWKHPGRSLLRPWRHPGYSLTAVLTALTLLHCLPWGSAKVIRKQMSSRVITTRYGKVRGILVEFPNRHLKPVEAFFGLKYADLEKGNMRFMPPKNPKEQWTKIRAAIQQRPSCPQLTRHEREYEHALPEGRVAHLRNITPFLTDQVEDCLTLNLYVPIPKWNDTTPMPVMVFVHGETYDSGTGNAYDGSVLASFGDVIVVTLNYRLGVLGFLTTLDHSAMGNLGLLDITQALLWLQDNIASFHGDPKRVTLFGHGHGASLVNLLLLSPFVSQGRGPFFQQAIIQSGSALSTWAVSYDPLWCTNKLAASVNCSSAQGDSHQLVNCLRHKTVSQLLHAAPDPPKYYSCFAPAIDEWTVLPTQVERLIQERKSKFSSVPVMFGITKNEAYSYLKQQEVHKGLSDLRKTQIIRTYVQNVFRYHRQKIFEILDHQYTDWTQPANKMTNRDNILELLSDGQYVAPLMRTANYHAESADTYLYAFSYSTQGDSGPQDSQSVQGIHGDELPYVFGSPLVDGLSPFPSSYTSVEKMMSEAVMTYWTNFAKTGNPNMPRNQSSIHGGKVHNRFMGLRWPKYDKTTQQYMQMSRRPAVRHHYRGQKLALWLDLIPKINVADGSDPASHLLNHHDNRSTFDDFHRLLPSLGAAFPSPPPTPPLSPTLAYPPDNAPTTSLWMGEDHNGAPPSGERYDPRSHGSVRRDDDEDDDGDDDTTSDDVAGGDSVTSEGEAGSTVPAGRVGGGGETGRGGEAGVVGGGGGMGFTNSLSITVAVGCTLLFLNLLIFAAVYYQRVRIRKLREEGRGGAGGRGTGGQGAGVDEEDQDEAKLSRKLEREARRTCGDLDPETDSLISYSYAPVPTHTTSPLHRPSYPPHAYPPAPSCNSTSSLPPYPPPPLLPLNTFSNNVGAASRGTRLGVGGGLGGVAAMRGGPAGSEAADTGLYKVIHKSGGPPPPQNRDGGSSANNAITIV
ncbi:neuroligin-2-like [Babylonia areolata]|uniref:neuroligin-2-like n=1 Tax=Babylonia areolata TaxID=304850 RepID=UPI003FD612D9